METHLQSVRFFSVISDYSTDSSVVDQEAILLRYVRPDTFESTQLWQVLKILKIARADGVVAAIISDVSKCGIDLYNVTESKLNLVCINFDGAAVNIGAKNWVAKSLVSVLAIKFLLCHVLHINWSWVFLMQ